MEGIKRRHLGESAWRELLARQTGGGESVTIARVHGTAYPVAASRADAVPTLAGGDHGD